jgi:hypothetical protein
MRIDALQKAIQSGNRSDVLKPILEGSIGDDDCAMLMLLTEILFALRELKRGEG